MSGPSIADVRKRCNEGRFFSYVGFHDRLFAPISVYLIWAFVRLGWSANAVCLLSGALAIAGGGLVGTERPGLILLGSFGYAMFYLLDYVDGGVARFHGKGSMGGQYLDWMMHVVSGLALTGGLFAGALRHAGPWIIPAGIMALIATALTLDKFAIGWFTIAMHQQQQRSRDTFVEVAIPSTLRAPRGALHRGLSRITMVLLKEDYLIFVLPFAAVVHFALLPAIDFRVVLIGVGGFLYFPLIVFDIWRMAEEGVIETAYHKLFFSRERPNLPADHFFR